MKKRYFQPIITKNSCSSEPYQRNLKFIDAWEMEGGQLFIHHCPDLSAKPWTISHKSGLAIVQADSFKEAKEIAGKLLGLVPDWSDAETESTGEKYAEVRAYVFKLTHPNWS